MDHHFIHSNSNFLGLCLFLQRFPLYIPYKLRSGHCEAAIFVLTFCPTLAFGPVALSPRERGQRAQRARWGDDRPGMQRKDRHGIAAAFGSCNSDGESMVPNAGSFQNATMCDQRITILDP
jgi:hypothetical protein